MNKNIYRGYEYKLGGGTGTRYYIYKNGVEVYSMTASDEEVMNWIDKDIRKNKQNNY